MEFNPQDFIYLVITGAVYLVALLVYNVRKPKKI